MRTIRLNSNSSTESSKSDSKKRLKSEPDDEEDDDTFKTGLIESKMLEIQKEVSKITKWIRAKESIEPVQVLSKIQESFAKKWSKTKFQTLTIVVNNYTALFA